MSLSSSHSYSVFRPLAMRYCNSFIPFLIDQSHASPELVSSSCIPTIEDRNDTLSSADSRSEAAASIQLCRTGSNTPAGSRLEVAIVLTGLGSCVAGMMEEGWARRFRGEGERALACRRDLGRFGRVIRTGDEVVVGEWEREGEKAGPKPPRSIEKLRLDSQLIPLVWDVERV